MNHKQALGWRIKVALGFAAGLFLLFMLSVAYDAGGVNTQEKLVKRIASITPLILYDVVFYNQSEMKVFTVPADPRHIKLMPGAMETCLVIERPQFRVYCNLVAFYPCTRNCTETK